jgi:hypothetical protein
LASPIVHLLSYAFYAKQAQIVRDMDPMKKDQKEKAYLAKYVSIIDEIEDEEFEDALVHNNMRKRYKGAKKDKA